MPTTEQIEKAIEVARGRYERSLIVRRAILNKASTPEDIIDEARMLVAEEHEAGLVLNKLHALLFRPVVTKT